MIIADTGFFVACFSKQDQYHKLASSKLRELSEPLITTWPVLTETIHVLTQRGNANLAANFMKQVTSGLVLIWNPTNDLIQKIPKLMKTYINLPMDLADASLVLLAEFLEDGRILSTDRRDFKSYRWKSRKPFTNLLLGD